MPNTSVPAAAEGVSNDMTVDKSKILVAEDMIYECAHLTQLVSMAIDSMQMNTEMRALSAGVHLVWRSSSVLAR